MVFCNMLFKCHNLMISSCHNPYFNRWFSAILKYSQILKTICYVTILILIDGFLQCPIETYNEREIPSHNPYFNRWFSAIS